MPTYLEPDDEKAITSKETIAEYENYLNEWKDRIDEVLLEEAQNSPEPGSALAEIEHWRNKAGTLSTLYQELTKPEVTKIKNRVNIFHERSVSQIYTSVTEFENSMKDLTKINSEAKDNVKFLNTLERQFKNLTSDDLSQIEQTIPSLLNGLRLVFIISRHYKSDEKMSNLLGTIADEICAKVESMINLKKLFQPKEDQVYEVQLEESL